jgi:hypothetical protein
MLYSMLICSLMAPSALEVKVAARANESLALPPLWAVEASTGATSLKGWKLMPVTTSCFSCAAQITKRRAPVAG